MLIVALALVALQHRDADISQKLLAAARKKGWVSAMHGHPIPGRHRFDVDERLSYGNHYVHIQVDESKTLAEAAFRLEHLKKTSEIRTPFDEPQLKDTGLKIDVKDYSNKRLSSLKGYAASNLRITGIVNKALVYIVAEPPGVRMNDAPKNPKSEEQVYKDVIGFAKLIAHELERN